MTITRGRHGRPTIARSVRSSLQLTQCPPWLKLVEGAQALDLFSLARFVPAQLCSHDVRRTSRCSVAGIAERAERCAADDGVLKRQRELMTNSPHELAADYGRSFTHTLEPGTPCRAERQHLAVTRSVRRD